MSSPKGSVHVLRSTWTLHGLMSSKTLGLPVKIVALLSRTNSSHSPSRPLTQLLQLTLCHKVLVDAEADESFMIWGLAKAETETSSAKTPRGQHLGCMAIVLSHTPHSTY